MPRDDPRADGLVYVILPVHNRRQITERFLRCLQAQSDRDFHLLLIDDGSSDGTADMARQSGVPLTVLTGRGDWWWGGSLQQAYDWLQARPRAGGEIVLIMNDDTQFEPGFLAAGRAALVRSPSALLLARRHDGRTGEYLDAGVQAVWSRLQFVPTRDPAQVDCFSTMGLFLRLSDFLDLGGFHPRLLPHYGSDYEFTMRARRRGYRLVSDPAVRIWFDELSTGDRDPRAGSLREYFRRCFSKRFLQNPLYWTSFILLSCPPAWILPNLFRVWYVFLGQIKDAATQRRAP